MVLVASVATVVSTSGNAGRSTICQVRGDCTIEPGSRRTIRENRTAG